MCSSFETSKVIIRDLKFNLRLVLRRRTIQIARLTGHNFFLGTILRLVSSRSNWSRARLQSQYRIDTARSDNIKNLLNPQKLELLDGCDLRVDGSGITRILCFGLFGSKTHATVNRSITLGLERYTSRRSAFCAIDFCCPARIFTVALHAHQYPAIGTALWFVY